MSLGLKCDDNHRLQTNSRGPYIVHYLVVKEVTTLLVYIDIIIVKKITSKKKSLWCSYESKNFEIKHLEKLKYFLGWR